MLRTISLGIVSLLLTFQVQAADPLVISNAWIPQAAPVAKMHAGYMQLKNTSSQTVVIVAAQSADYNAVEIHKTVTKDGMSRMIAQDKITVAPGETVKFERGGLHLMLMQPTRKLNIGDTVELTLITENKQSLPFTATVKAATLGEDDHGHHHHH